MKKKIITALTVLAVFAFPISSLAANGPATPGAYTGTAACPVTGCTIDGGHDHNSGCSVTGCTIDGGHEHNSGCPVADCTIDGTHSHTSSRGNCGRTDGSRSHGTSHSHSAGRRHHQ